MLSFFFELEEAVSLISKRNSKFCFVRPQDSFHCVSYVCACAPLLWYMCVYACVHMLVCLYVYSCCEDQYLLIVSHHGNVLFLWGQTCNPHVRVCVRVRVCVCFPVVMRPTMS
uniref:Uncharacterized protein n=1 Tax=Haplochromis burtoni TaxID=8153 RepID=A0A3Q2WZA4_HAPBU